jgi:hypothetical protein
MAHHTIKVSWFCRATLGSAVATEPNLTSGRSFDPEPQILVIASVYDGFRMTRVEERHTKWEKPTRFRCRAAGPKRV